MKNMARPGISIIKMPTSDPKSTTNLTGCTGEKVSQRIVLLPKQNNMGNQLVWRGGCLQSILSDVPSQIDHPNSGQPSVSFGENIQRKIINVNISDDNSLSLPSIRDQNQQDTASGGTCHVVSKNKNLKRSRDEFNSSNLEVDTDSSEEKSSKIRVTKPRIRSQTKRSGRRNAPKPVQQPLLLTLRPFHPPGNLLLPALDLMLKFDGLVSFENDKLITNSAGGLSTISEENIDETSATPNLCSSAAVRMKSSAGINDIDFEEFKHYRRLNGYSLFVHVNKKKYGSFPGSTPVDDTNDGNDSIHNGVGASISGKESQKSSNRRWQALWLTVPEKVKREWKNKAKRLLKQIEQHGKRENLSEDRKLRERDRLEAQLSRTQTTFYSLLDLAAHFQLLSDRFATFSKSVNDYEGPIEPVSVESLLLDGLLTSLIPLIALANELKPFSEVPDRKIICDALTNLTFIAPF
ncbi:26S proteasome non-ATPase regulatory subunit 9 [Schistosoma japonicum]|nr:26S proteasome non-ATPase regulatory subunit 9 [Schistosoma japonicum]